MKIFYRFFFVAKLYMIDLAGSERAAQTQNTGRRMMEGMKPNKTKQKKKKVIISFLIKILFLLNIMQLMINKMHSNQINTIYSFVIIISFYLIDLYK